MVGKYLWGTLQYHRLIDEFLHAQFWQHPEVDHHITLYMFDHRAPSFEVVALRQKVYIQSLTTTQMENTFKELWSNVDFLTDKSNRL